MSGRELPMLDVLPGPVGGGPGKEAEPDDPLELVGVPVPVDEGTFDEMAYCFIEEFIRDGWTDERLLRMFRSPYYAGLHVVLARRGEPWVRAAIADTRQRWHRPSPIVEGHIHG